MQSNLQLKSLDSRHVLPSTSMAAHAVDEVEIELEDNIGVVGTASTGVENETNGLPLTLPPPLPILKNNYSQVSLLMFYRARFLLFNF